MAFAGTDNTLPGLLGYLPTKEDQQKYPELDTSFLLLEKYPYWNLNLADETTNGSLQLRRVPIFDFQYDYQMKVSWKVPEDHCKLYEQRHVHLLVCIKDYVDQSNTQKHNRVS